MCASARPALVSSLALVLGLLAVAVAAGCGTGAAVPPDAPDDGGQDDARGDAGDAQGADDASEDASELPPPPEPPAPPQPPRADPALPAPPELAPWTCAGGWVAEPILAGTPLESSLCAPPPPPEDCADGTFAVVGQATCQPHGPACPAGNFAAVPADLPGTAAVLHVLAGAAAGGDGQAASPFATLAEGIAAAASGDVVLVGKGTYVEDVLIDRPLHLVGACVTGTVIQAATPSDEVATLEVTATGPVSVRALQVTGDRRGISIKGPGSSGGPAVGPLRVEGVLVQQARRQGIHFDLGATGELQDVVVRDTAEQEGTRGQGIFASAGSQVTVSRATLLRNGRAGVDAQAASVVTVTDLLVRDTHPETSSGDFGRGALAFDGASLRLERALLERNAKDGVAAFGRDGTGISQVTLSQVVIRDVDSAGVLPGAGLEVVQGGRLIGERVLIEGQMGYGIFVDHVTQADAQQAAPPELTLTQVVVRDLEDTYGGQGVTVLGPATVTLEQALVQNTRRQGLGAGLQPGVPGGATLTLTDTVVRDTGPEQMPVGSGTRLGGPGIRLEQATVTGERLLVEANHVEGMGFVGGRVKLTDLTVRGTLPHPDDDTGGNGIVATNAATLELTRALLEQNHDIAVGVSGGVETTTPVVATQMVLTDVTIRDTLPGALGGGTAIAIALEVALEASRLRAERSANTTLIAAGRDDQLPTLKLTDLQVSDSDGPSIYLYDAGNASVERAHFSDVGQAVTSQGAGSVTLTDVLVEGNPERPVADGRQSNVFLSGKSDDQGRPLMFATHTLERVEIRDPLSVGVLVQASELTMTDVSILRPRPTGSDRVAEIADGVFAFTSTGTLTRTNLEGCSRVALASLVSQIQILESRFECNRIDLNAEVEGGIDDAGGNSCGCAGQQVTCETLSSQLAAPSPPELEPPPAIDP